MKRGAATMWSQQFPTRLPKNWKRMKKNTVRDNSKYNGDGSQRK